MVDVGDSTTKKKLFDDLSLVLILILILFVFIIIQLFWFLWGCYRVIYTIRMVQACASASASGWVDKVFLAGFNEYC